MDSFISATETKGAGNSFVLTAVWKQKHFFPETQEK